MQENFKSEKKSKFGHSNYDHMCFGKYITDKGQDDKDKRDNSRRKGNGEYGRKSRKD